MNQPPVAAGAGRGRYLCAHGDHTFVCDVYQHHAPDAALPAFARWFAALDADFQHVAELSLALSAEPMKAVIGAYDFTALYDIQHARATKKRLDGISKEETTPVDHLVKGLPVRGLKTVLDMDGSTFSCEGELYMFGTVLSHFFALYPSINSFHKLEVVNILNNEHNAWPLRTGTQPVI